MILWLLRHPRTAVPEGVCYGRSDVELEPRILEESDELVSRVREDEPQVVYSSPLRRCRLFAERIGVPRVDHRLQELDFGSWELRSWNEIERTEIDQWRDQPLTWKAPGGESVAKLAERVTAFLADLEASQAAKACVVTHAGVIRVLGCLLWRRELQRLLDFNVPLASALRVEWKEGAARLLAHTGCERSRLPAWMR